MKNRHLFFGTNESEPAAEAFGRTSPCEAVRPPSPNPEGAEAEGELACCGGGFGVSVDLSRFFEDERARCVVWVPRGGARARWLAARLSARLGLGPPARLALLAPAAPAGLLHPDDPLLLLRPHCTLSVVPVDYNLYKDGSSGEKFEKNQFNEKEVLDTGSTTSTGTGPQAETANACERAGAGSGATPATAADEDALREVKQHALSLLAGLAADGGGSEQGQGEGGARTRRRRVRRRRRPAPDEGADLTDAPAHKVPKVSAAARGNSDKPENISGAEQGDEGGEGGEVEAAPSEREQCPLPAPARPARPAPALRRAPSAPAPAPRLVRALDTSAASLSQIYSTISN